MPSPPPLLKSSLTSFHIAAPGEISQGGLSDSNMESSLEDPLQDSTLDQIKEAVEPGTPAAECSSELMVINVGGRGEGTKLGGQASTGTPPPPPPGGPKGERFHAPLSSTPKTEGVEYVEEPQGEYKLTKLIKVASKTDTNNKKCPD